MLSTTLICMLATTGCAGVLSGDLFMIGSFGPSSFVISGPSSVSAGICEANKFLVEAVDVDRHAFMAMENLAIQVSVDGAELFLGPNCGVQGVRSLLIPAGRGSTEFFVRAYDSSNEVEIYLSSENGLARGEYEIRVNPPTPIATTRSLASTIETAPLPSIAPKPFKKTR